MTRQEEKIPVSIRLTENIQLFNLNIEANLLSFPLVSFIAILFDPCYFNTKQAEPKSSSPPSKIRTKKGDIYYGKNHNR